MNSRAADPQFPPTRSGRPRIPRDSRTKATAPDARRMVEKLAASISARPRASRQSTEFAAKATSADAVQRTVVPEGPPPLAVEQQERRHGAHVAERAHDLGCADREHERQLELGHELAHVRLLGLHGDRHDREAVPMALLEISETGESAAAGRTPGGPELDH